MPRKRGTWEDTGTYEVEAAISAFIERVARLEARWGSKSVRPRIGRFGHFLYAASRKYGDPSPQKEGATLPEKEEYDG